MVKVKELVNLEFDAEAIKQGNLACAGCQLNAAFKHTLSALKGDAIAVVPACCTSVIQGAGGGYGMNVPIFNTAFAAAPGVASGIKRTLLKKGNEHTQVIVWAGDGGTSDIGFASLSGIAERNENVIYVMYNNAGYQNTGNQKSGATPRGTKTTTTTTGKTTRNKNIARMMVAQGVEYVATANSAYAEDLYDKITRAATEFSGFRYIEIFSPCPPGWNVDTRDVHALGKLANETGFWPLWEAVNGKVSLSKSSKKYEDKTKRKPFSEFTEIQGRYQQVDEHLLQMAEGDIDYEWSWVERFMTEL